LVMTDDPIDEYPCKEFILADGTRFWACVPHNVNYLSLWLTGVIFFKRSKDNE